MAYRLNEMEQKFVSIGGIFDDAPKNRKLHQS